MQLHRICIVLFSVLSTLSSLLCRATINPNPEDVVQDVRRSINASVSRRRLQQGASGCWTGNPIDDCWRCEQAGWENDRQRLADCVIGFGKNAAGGKGGAFYTVTDPSDADAVNPKPGTLRYGAVAAEPLWITFAGDMTIELSQELLVAGFKTLDGRGAAVHLTRGAVTLDHVSNVIVHGVHMHGGVPTGGAPVRANATYAGQRGASDGDGITVIASRDVWIDHCALSECTDGLIDVVRGSTAVTVSNCEFSLHDKVMLLGEDDEDAADRGMQVTVAFNVFREGLGQRMPRCRLGYFHVVNNDYRGWKLYAIGGTANPTINSQGNRFRALDDPAVKQVTSRIETGDDWKRWNWRSEGDIMLNGAFFVQSGSAQNNAYTLATSADPICSNIIDQLTFNAGPMLPSGNTVGKSLPGPAATCGVAGGSRGGYGYGVFGNPYESSAPPPRLPPIALFFLSSIMAWWTTAPQLLCC